MIVSVHVCVWVGGCNITVATVTKTKQHAYTHTMNFN